MQSLNAALLKRQESKRRIVEHEQKMMRQKHLKIVQKKEARIKVTLSATYSFHCRHLN